VGRLSFRMAMALAALASIVGLGVACGGGQESDPTGTPAESATAGHQSSLLLDGLVRSPLDLTLDDLSAMPKTTEYVELYCVDYPTVPVEKGDWTGVRLGLLLEQAGVSTRAVKVAFYDDYGYSTDLTITTAMREDVILAYERDGVPLDGRLRLVLPGKWGYKWVSGVTHIELVDYDFTGVWESRGYSDEADITAEPTSSE
jgi:DMSO/TMAO reductase YedYZ molybdopterin-dependent catalytic subunit